MKLDTLTERFMEGTVWVEHSGFIVKEFAKNKNGCPETMSEKFLARMCGLQWQQSILWHLKDDVEAEIKEKKVA